MTTTTTQTLIEAVTSLLSTGVTVDDVTTYPTDAGARVYAPRDWPTWDAQYPALFISAPRERKESLGRNQPQFTVISSIRVSARASAPGAANDGNAGVVQDALWSLQRQIEVALINAPADTLPIQQFASVEAEMAFSASGEKHLGELAMDFELEFYQGPCDFAPIVWTALTEVAIANNLDNPSAYPGLDLTLDQ